MKLTILGKHPVPQGGFNGVMSLFEALGFCRLGYEVTLAIPMTSKDEYGAFLDEHKLQSLDQLDRFGGNFSIVPVFPDGEGFDECDVCVYQSYFEQDYRLFFPLIREKAKLRTKNFPKFVHGPEQLPEAPVKGQLNEFDLVACALREDFDHFRADAQFYEKHKSAVAYVPRGASPEMLHPGFKAGLPPTIGLDTPNSQDLRAVEHYYEPIKRLRNEFRDLRVLSVGKAIPELDTETIKFGRFDRLYDSFFNQIHAYGVINYEFSEPHLQARIHLSHPAWKKKAIYEVQNIEAQMSGASVIGHRDNIIAELVSPGKTGFMFQSYSASEPIYQTLRHALLHRNEIAAASRAFALKHFSWESCIQRWSDAIQIRWNTLYA